MKKFLFLLVMLMLAVTGGWLAWQRLHSQRPSEARALPSLPKPAREFRFAVLGRPSELPLRALARMPEMQDLPLRFISCKSPAERWLLLASGQADAAIASSDELALALPRYRLEARLFPLARHQGNEQVLYSKDQGTPPWVAYLPGGISQSLALDLKDPQLKLMAVETPEQALALLKAGQIRGCSLWNPWLSESKSQGFEAKGNGSTSFEVWISCGAGVEAGRLEDADQPKAVRAWFDLMRQLSEQPELTQKAIAEENDINPLRVPVTLQGLQFISASTLLGERARLAEELRTEMKDKVNLWSLAGQPVGGDLDSLKVDLDWLDALGLEGTPEESPVATPSPETPEELPTPDSSATPVAHGDPFDRPLREASEVSQAGGDSSRSGRLPGPALVAEPRQVWSASLASEPTTAPVASPDGQQLFVGTADGNLSCLDRATGRLIWNYPMGEQIRSAPACAGQWVQVGCDSGRITSIDRLTGQRRWEISASSDIRGALAISDDAVYGATLDGEVLCLELATGTERWKQTTSTNITAALAVTQEHVIACGIDRKVRALKKSDGSVDWEVKLGDACKATPSVESGLIMVGCADHYFYGLREFDGTQAWKQKLPDEVVGASVALGRNVYVGCKDNTVYCFDRGTGKKLWNYATRERITNDLVGCAETVYAVSQDMRLYALSTEGKLRFKVKLSGWLQTPWLQDQTLYVPVADNTVRALK